MMATQRRINRGVRKICGCARRQWAKCPHSWHFNFKMKGGPAYRFSIDSEAGKHIAAKADAEALADGWRSQIRSGTFRRALPAVGTAPAVDMVTLEKFTTIYAARLGKPVTANHQSCVKRFLAFVAAGESVTFGGRALTAFTEDDLEVFYADLLERDFAASTRNKYVQMIKALFRWATKKGYLPSDPAADSDILKRRKHAQRHRRLETDEETRLLAQAGRQLQRLIIAALETCCRRGELLSLQWRHVHFDRREITIVAERSKTKTERVLPMSARLKAVLEMATTDAAGDPFTADHFVFGDSTGARVKDVKRAWQTCVLKAHGHTPAWTDDNTLAASSREALRAIDLTFHDLRHEAGSRLLEAGWPLHEVSAMLGHTNIAQTSTYLNAKKVGMQASMRRLDAARCNPLASDPAIDPAPLCNDEPSETRQPLIN